MTKSNRTANEYPQTTWCSHSFRHPSSKAMSTTLSDNFMTMRGQYRHANEAILACFRLKNNHGWSNTWFHRIARNTPAVYQGNIDNNRIDRMQLAQLHPNWIHSKSRGNHEYRLLNSKIRKANQSPGDSHKDTTLKKSAPPISWQSLTNAARSQEGIQALFV